MLVVGFVQRESFSDADADLTATIEDFENLVADAEALVEIDGPAGMYTPYCEPHSDMSEADPEQAGMVGTLVIR